MSLMHTLSDKVRFVQRKLKPAEAFTIKKWMVLAEHLLAEAQIQCVPQMEFMYLVFRLHVIWQFLVFYLLR